jgi:predicted TIM-barrel fold metal-dependent hydrolase
MTMTERERTLGPAATDRIVAVTADSHVGPLLAEQLRAYCPKKHLEQFDEFISFAKTLPVRTAGPDPDEDPRRSHLRNALTTGGWDVHQRLRDMDRDGVAGEIVFHGLNTGRQDFLPWNGPFGAFGLPGFDPELVGVGRHLYNEWLADFVSVEPERHAGLAHLPMWDPEAAVKELEWAASKGLRGVNFPRPQAAIPAYNDPVWDPFWSACEDFGMPLTTHAQSGPPPGKMCPGDLEINLFEIMSDVGRQALTQLVFGGVFDRHPKLKLVYTEVLDTWFSTTLARMDNVAMFLKRQQALPASQQLKAGGGAARSTGLLELSKLPSEYCLEQVFIGWTALAPFEAEDAVRNGYASQVLWGSDYPHPEGSWQLPREDDEPPMTHLHLRDTFARVPAEAAAAMIGGNAMRVYGFDPDKLRAVANRINSLTFEQLAVPLEHEPEDFVTRSAALAFRRTGPFV